MIFTRRFGALAARPTFPVTEERTLEQELELIVEHVAHERGDDARVSTDSRLPENAH